MSEAALPVVRDNELDRLARLGQWLALSESGKDDPVAKGASAALRFYYAEQLGLPPLAAAELSVINGKLFVGAQILRALAARRGLLVEEVDGSDESCTVALVERASGKVIGQRTFTLEDARRAGLIRDRSPWKTHPARMLWARASKNVIVDFAPEVALGIYLDDERQEVTGQVVETYEPDPDFSPEEEIEWPGDEPAAEVTQVTVQDEFPVPE
jgi:hypothetical protein